MFSAASSTTAPDADVDDLVTETARVVHSDRGLRVNGYLMRSADDPDRVFGCSYSLLTDPAGNLRRLTVRADSPLGERSLSLTKAPGSPWVLDRGDGQQVQPDIHEDTDVVLAGSALGLALAGSRLAALRSGPDATASVEVSIIDVPELTLSSEHVSYRTVAVAEDGTAEIAVTSGNGETFVTLGADGALAAAPIAAAR